jgi:hypothetical protein
MRDTKTNTQFKKAVSIGASILWVGFAYVAVKTFVHDNITLPAIQQALHPTEMTDAPAAKVAAPLFSLAEKVHYAQVVAADAVRRTLPKMLDDATTLTDVRVAGGRLVYMYEVTIPSVSAADGAAFQADATKKVCSSDMRKVIGWGGSYGYEYWHAGRLVYSFTISSCA